MLGSGAREAQKGGFVCVVLQVVVPCIWITHLALRPVSLELNGRTRTATFTDADAIAQLRPPNLKVANPKADTDKKKIQTWKQCCIRLLSFSPFVNYYYILAFCLQSQVINLVFKFVNMYLIFHSSHMNIFSYWCLFVFQFLPSIIPVFFSTFFISFTFD